MDIITIPPPPLSPGYKPVLNQEPIETDSPAPLIQVHGLLYNRQVRLSSESFLIRNNSCINLEPKTWRFIVFPMTVVTNLPAVCVVICHLRTLYSRGLYQPVFSFNTNDSYIKIPLFNDTLKVVTLRPFELPIRCTIILQKKPYKLYRN